MRIVGLHRDCEDCEKGEPRLRWDCELLKWSLFWCWQRAGSLAEGPVFCGPRFDSEPCLVPGITPQSEKKRAGTSLWFLYALVLYSTARSFSDCIGISGEIEDCKWICRIVSSSGNEVEIVGSSWGQEMCRKC